MTLKNGYIEFHCEPFACHSERSEESRFIAQGKLREAISLDCRVACATRNDYFVLSFALVRREEFRANIECFEVTT
jgi:hypothetical protein